MDALGLLASIVAVASGGIPSAHVTVSRPMPADHVQDEAWRACLIGHGYEFPGHEPTLRVEPLGAL